MPKIKVDYVVSFSSEDPIYVANNILVDDPSKKWKCKNKGEISATLILQLEKASVITGIDIGNENSAYIEVLVARSGSPDEDYKGLLLMSSFMTASEAREGKNPQQVRMFQKADLQKPACDEKWDRIKIICTQPFSRHVQYGLSFIRFHSSGDIAENVAPIGNPEKLKALFPDILKGSLFNKYKEQKKEPLSVASAIREATASPSTTKKKIVINSTTPSTSKRNDFEVKKLPRNRNEIFYSKDEEIPHEKIDKLMEKHNQELKEKKEKEKKEEELAQMRKKHDKEAKEKTLNERYNKEIEKIERELKKTNTKPSSNEKMGIKRKLDEPSTSSTSSPAKKINKQATKPFSQLLSGVVFVISGIQNPDRANLRSKALGMGAKYMGDWGPTCTHLICAFVNTPKFKEVQGKGKIVTKKWIEECHSQRKRLPWRRYCLDRNDRKQPESEDEICEQEETKSAGSDTDAEEEGDDAMQKRIQEILAKQKANKKTNESVFDTETDEEPDINGESCPAPDLLPDLFGSKTFFIDPSLEADLNKRLVRYVTAYNGKIIDEVSANYYISETKPDPIIKNCKFVRPDWLWDCHNQQKLVSTSPYLI